MTPGAITYRNPNSGATTVAGEPTGLGEIAGACGFDPGKPNPARIYDYLLGGKDHFAADRRAAHRLLSSLPDPARAARAERLFPPPPVLYLAHRRATPDADHCAPLPPSPNPH